MLARFSDLKVGNRELSSFKQEPTEKQPLQIWRTAKHCKGWGNLLEGRQAQTSAIHSKRALFT